MGLLLFCAGAALDVAPAAARPDVFSAYEALETSGDPSITFSNRVPADSSVLAIPPKVFSVDVTGSAALMQVGASVTSLKLDGAEIGHLSYFDLGTGQEVYDPEYGEWYWIADVDPMRGTLIGSRWQSLLPDGEHSLVAVVQDELGAVATTSWSFSVMMPASIISVAPVDGATVITSNPVISVVVDENDAAVLPEIRLNGMPLTVTRTKSGAYYNYDRYTYSATSPLLADRSVNTVDVLLRDAMGNEARKSWSFSVRTSSDLTVTCAQISGPTTFDVPRPFLSYVITDTMPLRGLYGGPKVDGQPTNDWFGFSDDNKRLDTWGVPQSDLTDGEHVGRVTVIDGLSRMTYHNFPFTVAVKPTASMLAPIDGSCADSTTPTISAVIYDNSTVAPAMTLRLDGAVVPHTYNATTKTISYQVPEPLGDEAPHAVSLHLRDAAGHETTTEWSFTVQSGSPMAHWDARPNCKDCHGDGMPHHPDAFFRRLSYTCVTCHYDGHNAAARLRIPRCNHPEHRARSTDPDHLHGDVPGAPTWANHCGDLCHGDTHSVCADNCRLCHSMVSSRGSSTPGKPLETPTHTTTQDMTTCVKCHKSELRYEHAERTGSNGQAIDCNSCHGSTDPLVQAAMAEGDMSCSACHPNANHLELHDSSFRQSECSGCHDRNLVTEHVTRKGLTCETCHDRGAAVSPQAAFSPLVTLSPVINAEMPDAFGASPHSEVEAAVSADRVAAAIAAGNTACEACHDDPPPHGTSGACSACHGAVPPTIDGSEASTGPTGWDPGGENAAVPTPHKGYSSSTDKCGVCHSVHMAPANGEMLLRTTVAAACEYCHVTTNLGGTVVYGGVVERYYSVSDSTAHNRTSYSSCRSCHSVHGSNTLGGANDTKILRDWSLDDTGPTYTAEVLDMWPDPASLNDDDAQITAWCSGCHKYFVQSHDTTLTTQSFDHYDTYDWVPGLSKSHIMTATIDSFSNPAASPAVQGTQVAYRPSAYCTDCHDAGDRDAGTGVVTSSFPHSTPEHYKFMSKGSSAASAASTNTLSGVDGLCLKCHKGDDSNGVGIDY